MSFQPRAYRALLGAFLWMDLRNDTYGQATRTTAGELLPPLYLVIGQFLATSMLASMALYLRTDARFFALASLGLTFVLLFSALVVEFHEVVLDASDPEVIGHHPISARTYALARLSNLAVYVGLMTIASSIFPAILGATLADAPAFFVPAYLLAAGIVAIATSAIVILLFTTLGAGGVLDKARALLSWVQIIAIMLVFYGGQLMVRDAGGGLEMLAARPPQWLEHVPLAWLASAVAGDLDARAGYATFGALVLAGLAASSLGRAWSRISAGEERTHAAHARGEALAGTTLPKAKDRVEAATYWLVRTSFRRDQELALRSWPTFAIALAALVLGILTEQLASPLTEQGPAVVMSTALYVLIASAIPTLYQNLRYSRDHAATWMFRTAPIASKISVARGIKRALRRTFFAPILVVLAIVLAAWWRAPLDVIVHVALVAAVIEAAAAICEAKLLFDPPFSRASVRGAATQQISMAGIYVTTSAMGVAGVQYALGPVIERQIALVAAVAIAAVALAKYAEKVVQRQLDLGAAKDG